MRPVWVLNPKPVHMNARNLVQIASPNMKIRLELGPSKQGIIDSFKQ